jgi:5-formyltetrahydrofolate cyclo-ligase
MKQLRGDLLLGEVLDRSRKIEERLRNSRLLDGMADVAMYASVRNEVATAPLFSHLQKQGCRIFFPRVTPEGVEFVRVDRWASLVPATWGILEPSGGFAIGLGLMDAILIPGLAFDEAGRRLGFGQGYYDRALEAYRGKKIGLAYDFQVLEVVPSVATDLVCDWIVTETRVIRGTAGKEP